MPKIKNMLYVITIKINGRVHYFEHEEMGTINPITEKTIKKPRGFFSTDVKDAKKFHEKWMAEVVASAYKGAHVELIKSGERLK